MTSNHPLTAKEREISRNVREALAAADMNNVGDLAEELAITRRTASNRFHGRIPYTVADLETLAVALGVGFDYLTRDRLTR